MTWKSFWALKMSNNSIPFLCPSEKQWPDDCFEPWKCPKKHSRTKLWAFEKKIPENWVLNEWCPFQTAAKGTNFDEIQKFLWLSDRKISGHYSGNWNFRKRYRVTDDQSLVTNRGTFCPVLHQSVTFSGFHCFHFHCVLFLVISFQTPPSKIQDSGHWASEAFLTPTDLRLRFSGVVIK